MARRGDVVENPMTGERITFLETARDTDGELLRFEYVLPPGWSVPEHVHPARRNGTRSFRARSEVAWEVKSETTGKAR